MKKKSEVGWVSRELFRSPVYIGICLTEEHLKSEQERLKWKEELIFPKPDHAKLWYLESTNPDFKPLCLLCLNITSTATELEIHGLIVHETQHIWKYILKNINEKKPSSELEAWLIQALFQNITETYDNMKKKMEAAS